MSKKLKSPSTIILASKSPSRQALLLNAGLSFSSIRPDVDERAVEAPYMLDGATPDFLAGVLAREKALDVSTKNAGSYVIGGDQVMAFEGRPYSKPESREEATEHLKILSGKSHYLYSALSIAYDGEVVFSACETATLQMRILSDRAIDVYLAKLSDEALFSSGIYQLEGIGIQLFTKIDGDFFTILGLPMLALLAGLRKMGAIDE